MKRVVIVGADFVPSSLPPATRIRFMATHLPKFGWEPIILTTSPEYYETAIDPENEQLLPNDLQVVRTKAFRAGWTRKLGVGDLGIRSLLHQWQALKKLCLRQKIDLILIPVPPYVSMVLGRLANKTFGIPYVIDYIDPWVTESYWRLPKAQRPPKWPLAYALSRTLEPFAVNRAAAIVGVSKGTTESILLRHPRLKAGPEIPYGAAVDDIEYVRRHVRNNEIFDKNDGNIHVSYVGAYTETMRQPLSALLEGFKLGLKERPELFQTVRLHFVGTTYSTNGRDPYRVTAVAREIGVEKYVHEHPFRVSYLDSLQLMLDSNGLILLGSNEPHYSASKIFPYVMAGKPLVSVFHEKSNVISIINDISTQRVITFGAGKEPMLCADEIRKRIEYMLQPLNGQLTPNWQELQKYSCTAMAERLATVMDAAAHVR